MAADHYLIYKVIVIGGEIMIKTIVAVVLLAATMVGAMSGGSNLRAAEKHELEESVAAQNEQEVTLGSRVTFGHYPADSEGKIWEPVQWQVLEINQGKVLLYAVQVIEAKAYHETRATHSWQEADLRRWLNSEFLAAAFNEQEQAVLRENTLPTGNEDGQTLPADKVFLLSRTELDHYLPQAADRVNKPTPWAKNGGVYVNEKGEAAFWLRSVVREGQVQDYISSHGTPGNRVHYADELVIGIRPAIWVDRMALRTHNVLQ